MEPLDCGDHSCDFAKDKSGMRTNGGCRCLKPMGDVQRHKVKQHIKQLELQIGELKDELQHAQESRDSWKGLVEEAHTVLTAGGVEDATGRPCDDKNCQSKLIHRINDLLRKRDETNRLVDTLKNHIKDLGIAWRENWDCSAHPGHAKVDNAFERVDKFLWDLHCHEQVPPTGEPCGEKPPCKYHTSEKR